jgi:hypothetical protein
MNEGVKNYYEIPYLVQYVPLDGVYDVFFNNTMQSIYELMDKAYEEEKEKKQHNPEECIHSTSGYGKIYCEHLTCDITEKDCYNCENFKAEE